MKKFVSLLLAVVLVLSVSVCAYAAPSKTTNDMTRVETTVENEIVAEEEGFVVKVVDTTDAGYQQRMETVEKEIETLNAAADVQTYFGEIVTTEETPVTLEELTGKPDAKVREMGPIVAYGYEESMGAVKVKLQFASVFDASEKCVVLIGVVEEGKPIRWIAYDAEVVDGSLVVEFDPDMVLKIQNGTVIAAAVQ